MGASVLRNPTHLTPGTYVDSIHVLVCDHPVFSLHLLSMNSQRKILGHDTINVDDLDTRRLEGLAETFEWLVAIEVGTVQEATCPREYRSNGVRRRLVTLLVFTIVASDGTVCCFAFDDLAVWRNELTGHHAQRTEALRKDVRLNITVVVLTRPDESSRRFDSLSNHVVDKTVFIVDAELLEVSLVLGVVDFLEDVLEATVVSLHDRVLGGHELYAELSTTNVRHENRMTYERHLLGQGHLERGVCETCNRLGKIRNERSAPQGSE